MLTKEQLNMIKEHVAKATPGEWFYDSYTVCTDEIFDGDGGLIETVTLDYTDRHGDVRFKEETDAQFVAHARQDIPALVAEVERLRGEYEASEDLFHRTNEQLGYEQEENKRLREALQLIQNSDGWLVTPEPICTVEQAYFNCVEIADNALGGVQK